MTTTAKIRESVTIVPGGTPGATPLLSVAFQNAGMVRGGRAIATLAAWAIAEQRTQAPLVDVEGRGRTTAAMRAYAAYWEMSDRTAWRDLLAFRAAFPAEETPERMTAMVREIMGAHLSRKRPVAHGQMAGLMAA